MAAIRQIVNDHDAADSVSESALPLGVQCVVINHQPIWLPGCQGIECLTGVFLPGHTQPPCVVVRVSVVRFHLIVTGCGQQGETVAFARNQFTQMAFMFTTNKPAFVALASKLIGQCQAAHHVAGADLYGGICAKDYQHVQPPSTTKFVPLTKLDASEIKNDRGP